MRERLALSSAKLTFWYANTIKWESIDQFAMSHIAEDDPEAWLRVVLAVLVYQALGELGVNPRIHAK
jgi:hypothetical protein